MPRNARSVLSSPCPDDPASASCSPGIEELLGDGVAYRFERRIVRHYFYDIAHALDVYRTYFGPTHAAFEAVGEAGAVGLALDIAKVLERYNSATDGTLIIDGEYLETIAIKR